MKNTAVYGIFPTQSAAENAISQLEREGFKSSEVSVLFSSPEGTQDFAHENSTKAPEGAAAGGVSGATIGGVLGWLVGIGSLAIPGVGPFVAAGPIMGMLAGAGVGGALGTLTGALVGMGIPEYEAKRYESRINDGGVLLSVMVTDKEWEEKARNILESTGAEDVSKKNEVPTDSTTTSATYPIA
jgi:hypothetical protein